MREAPKRTPLFFSHQRERAKFVEFAGWELPLHFGSILDEAKVVRASCGMFDVSHMGRIGIRVRGSVEVLDKLLTMNVNSIVTGQVRYGFLCNEQGGVIDDLTVAKLGEREFLLIVNAARREIDLNWLRQHLNGGAEIEDLTFETAMIAVQGPDSLEIVDSFVESDRKPSDLKRFHVGEFSLLGARCLVSRTGYTGEDGVEIICHAHAANRIWEELRAKGIQPCGLGARDILRLEAGMCLYDHDLSEDITPVEADLTRFLAMEKAFIGRDAIEKQLNNGVRRKRIGLKLLSRSAPRKGATVSVNGQPVGTVTSGVFSPHLNTAIAMAYVATEWASFGLRVQVLIRDKPQDAEIVPMPFLPLPSKRRTKDVFRYPPSDTENH